jgi:hypothetical protein
MAGSAYRAGAMVEAIVTRYVPPFLKTPLLKMQHRRWNFGCVVQLGGRSNMRRQRHGKQNRCGFGEIVS